MSELWQSQIGFLSKRIWRVAWIGTRFVSPSILKNDIQDFCGDTNATLVAKDAVVKQNARSGKEKHEITRICCRLIPRKQIDLKFRKKNLQSLKAKRRVFWQKIIMKNKTIREKTSLTYFRVRIDQKVSLIWHLFEL